MNRPTFIIITTNTYTTMSTIVITVVSGTGTVPTTLFSTVVVASVRPATVSRETYTIHPTETWRVVTSEIVSEVVQDDTLPNRLLRESLLVRQVQWGSCFCSSIGYCQG